MSNNFVKKMPEREVVSFDNLYDGDVFEFSRFRINDKMIKCEDVWLRIDSLTYLHFGEWEVYDENEIKILMFGTEVSDIDDYDLSSFDCELYDMNVEVVPRFIK